MIQIPVSHTYATMVFPKQKWSTSYVIQEKTDRDRTSRAKHSVKQRPDAICE
jgi:hypothetical protein